MTVKINYNIVWIVHLDRCHWPRNQGADSVHHNYARERERRHRQLAEK